MLGHGWAHRNGWNAWTLLGPLQWLECLDMTGLNAMIWGCLDMTVAIAMIGMFGHGWGHYNDWHAWAWAGPLQCLECLGMAVTIAMAGMFEHD